MIFAGVCAKQACSLTLGGYDLWARAPLRPHNDSFIMIYSDLYLCQKIAAPQFGCCTWPCCEFDNTPIIKAVGELWSKPRCQAHYHNTEICGLSDGSNNLRQSRRKNTLTDVYPLGGSRAITSQMHLHTQMNMYPCMYTEAPLNCLISD